MNLSLILVSPFVGWDHEQVRAIAGDRRASLWEALGEASANDERAAEARAWLSNVLGMADLATPYVFLDRILSGPLQGRQRLLARLGMDAAEAINELLTQALLFEQNHPPSIEGFLAWAKADGGEVKRDVDTAATEVQLMTIHGSKGLEAPVVVLADAAHGRGNRRNQHVSLQLPTGDALPIFKTGPGKFPAVAGDAAQQLRTAEEQEELRLLYVAITRAADHLFIGGAVSETTARQIEAGTENSRWWVILQTLLDEHSECERYVSSHWDSEKNALRLRRGEWGTTTKAPTHIQPAASLLDIGPSLALDVAPRPERPGRPLAPSALEEGPPEGPPSPERRAAAERGRLIHGLFERLIPMAPADRPPEARRWLQQRRGAPDLADLVLGVLDRPELQPWFAEGGLPEAPIAGLVGKDLVSGTIDLLQMGDTIRFLDFKTGLSVPSGPEQVPTAYIRQVEAYRALLKLSFPGRPVEAALLYTAGPKLIFIPAKEVDVPCA